MMRGQKAWDGSHFTGIVLPGPVKWHQRVGLAGGPQSQGEDLERPQLDLRRGLAQRAFQQVGHLGPGDRETGSHLRTGPPAP